MNYRGTCFDRYMYQTRGKEVPGTRTQGTGNR